MSLQRPKPAASKLNRMSSATMARSTSGSQQQQPPTRRALSRDSALRTSYTKYRPAAGLSHSSYRQKQAKKGAGTKPDVMCSSLPAWPPPISAVHVGSRVVLNGQKQGVLKYVGPVYGKDGIYGGIELDEPAGFNDGSFRGLAYFSAKPDFGVFAPVDRVRLLTKIKRDRTFERTHSSNFNSMTKSLNEQLIEAMVSHQEGSYEDLFDIEPPPQVLSDQSRGSVCTSSSVDTGSRRSSCAAAAAEGEEAEPEEAQPEAMTSSSATVRAEAEPADLLLLASETDELLVANTPSNESAPSLTDSPAKQSAAEAEADEMDSADGQVLHVVDANAISTSSHQQRPLSAASVDTGFQGDSSADTELNKDSKTEPEPVIKPSISVTADINKENVSTDDGSAPHAMSSVADSNKLLTSTPRPASKRAALLLSPAASPVAVGPVNARVDHRRPPAASATNQADLLRSPATQAAVRPAKPKAMSKHQKIMEQIKASKEAEKNKPKKEIKSTIAAIMNAPPPPPKRPEPSEKVAAEMPAAAAVPSSSSTATGSSANAKPTAATTRRPPLGTAKGVNQPNATAAKPTSSSSKPRQSLLPPAKGPAPKRRAPGDSGSGMAPDQQQQSSSSGGSRLPTRTNSQTSVASSSKASTTTASSKPVPASTRATALRTNNNTAAVASQRGSISSRGAAQRAAGSSSNTANKPAATTRRTSTTASMPSTGAVKKPTMNGLHSNKIDLDEHKRLLNEAEQSSAALATQLETGRAQLAQAGRAVDVLGVLNDYHSRRQQGLQHSLALVHHALADTKQQLASVESEKSTLFESHTKAVEDLHLERQDALHKLKTELVEAHELELQRLADKHHKQQTTALAELTAKHETNTAERVEETKLYYEQELQARECEFKQHVEKLKAGHAEQLGEVQTQLEESTKRLHDLQNMLKQSSDEKFKALGQEVDSLQFALQLRQDELKALRAHSAELELKVADIPEKDIEIRKLHQKLDDARSQLERKKDVERVLVRELEELRQSARKTETMSQSLRLEKDELEYKLSLAEHTSDEDERLVVTPYNARVRSSNSECGGEPGPSQHQQPNDAMSKSLLHTYMTSGRRAKHANGEAKVLILPDQGTLRRQKQQDDARKRLSFAGHTELQSTGVDTAAAASSHSHSAQPSPVLDDDDEEQADLAEPHAVHESTARNGLADQQPSSTNGHAASPEDEEAGSSEFGTPDSPSEVAARRVGGCSGGGGGVSDSGVFTSSAHSDA